MKFVAILFQWKGEADERTSTQEKAWTAQKLRECPDDAANPAHGFAPVYGTGLREVSLETVAQACGVTKASVYYYFNNKSELFTEALLFVLHIACAQTGKLIRSDLPLRERLIAVAEGICAMRMWTLRR